MRRFLTESRLKRSLAFLTHLVIKFFIGDMKGRRFKCQLETCTFLGESEPLFKTQGCASKINWMSLDYLITNWSIKTIILFHGDLIDLAALFSVYTGVGDHISLGYGRNPPRQTKSLDTAQFMSMKAADLSWRIFCFQSTRKAVQFNNVQDVLATQRTVPTGKERISKVAGKWNNKTLSRFKDT